MQGASAVESGVPVVPATPHLKTVTMEKNPFFKSVDYYDRRKARAAIAVALMQAGWKVYDYKPDKSDAMSDYFDPADWDGLATKGAYVLVVDCNDARNSGQEIKHTDRQYQQCADCRGTGADPDPEAWTLEQARANAAAFNKWNTARRTPGAVPGMETIVSPLYFTDSGKLKCEKCHGSGKTLLSQTSSVVDRYPVYQANPNRKAWHLEKDGKVITDGMSLSKMTTGYWQGDIRTQRQAVDEQIRLFIEGLDSVMGDLPKATQPVESKGMEIVDYSDRAFAVRGDTFPHRQLLSDLGGKFNAFLKGPDGKRFKGWIFSRKHEAEVRHALKDLGNA